MGSGNGNQPGSKKKLNNKPMEEVKKHTEDQLNESQGSGNGDQPKKPPQPF